MTLAPINGRRADASTQDDPVRRGADDAPVSGRSVDVQPAYTRRVEIYDPHAAFGLVDELEFLTGRTLEPNVFFTPRFLVPAMPRLDDRRIRLIVARDEDARRSRLRFLMPFSVERLAFPQRIPMVRAWTHPFGPLGTLPLDQDDPEGTAASLFDALRAPRHALPNILVLPDLRLEGPMAKVLIAAARARSLPIAVTHRYARARLDASGDPLSFLRSSLGAKGHRDHRRRLRMLGRQGEVGFTVAQSPDGVRDALEDFLSLEASGWKGRGRSALLHDRHRAAFAREAVNGLAEQDRVRVFTLRLGAEPIASLVVLVCNGEAVAWKTAYDERQAAAAPGALVAALASEALVADPAIRFVDSCAVPDHRVMNRLWKGRTEIGTLVIGLEAGLDDRVAAASAGLQAARDRLNRRRIWRNRLASVMARTRRRRS